MLIFDLVLQQSAESASASGVGFYKSGVTGGGAGAARHIAKMYRRAGHPLHTSGGAGWSADTHHVNAAAEELTLIAEESCECYLLFSFYNRVLEFTSASASAVKAE